MTLQLTANPRRKTSLGITANSRATATVGSKVNWDSLFNVPLVISDLTEITTPGIIVTTDADGNATSRTLQPPAAGLTIAHPAGTAGDPTFALADDLAGLEAISGTGLVSRTAADTYTPRTITAPAAGVTVSNGDGVAGNPTLALADDLAGLEAMAGTGLVSRTASNTYAQRTITAPAAGVSVTNGDGVSGNPTLALADDLAALEAMSGTGLVARTASNTYAQRTITAPAAGITVSNGDGVSGNPTLALANDLAGLEGMSGTGHVVRTGDGTYAQRTLTGPAAGISVSNGSGVSGNPTLALANDLAGLEGVTGTGIPVRTGTDAWAVRSATISSDNDLTGVRNASLTGYADFAEIASPSNPAADHLVVFAKDVTGSTHLFTRDSAGTEVDLSTGGSGGAAAANQTEMEAGSDTTVFTSPGRQHYHPSAAKWWASITVSGGTPTLVASYNVTSIADTAVGRCTVTIAADFSSANWSGWCTPVASSGVEIGNLSTKAAGTIILQSVSASSNTFADPGGYDAGGFGDQ